MHFTAPSSNLLKTGDMDTGTVSFKNEQKVRRFHVPERQNAIVNRLAKTKMERIVDHEAERVERIKKEGRRKRLATNERVSFSALASFFDKLLTWISSTEKLGFGDPKDSESGGGCAVV